MGIDVLKLSSVDWKPSPAIALATSADDSRVAVAREDGSLEIWLVSPGSIGWHCQLTIHGDPKSRVSSLVWCSQGGSSGGRLLSSSNDGSVSEWDLFDLKQQVVLDSIGVSIWQMAVAPVKGFQGEKELEETKSNGYFNGKINGDENQESSSEDDDADDSVELNKILTFRNPYIALACDDGCVRLYSVTESDELIYFKSLPRVKGRILSVTWSPDGKLLYCGSSDGFIRCWDVNSSREMHSIPVEIPGSRGGAELCVWALLALRNGTLVSGDSSGNVQFWDCRHGTLLQAHSLHKGDVNALAAVPSHKRVFSAGSDGQVVHYKLSSNAIGSGDDISSSGIMKKWVHVGQVRAHSHDVRALTVAMPICREEISSNEKVKRQRTSTKPMEFSYHKWAHLGVPMLISAGDDTKLFAYSANEFSRFSPHDICPAPQRVPIQLVPSSSIDQEYFLLVQAPYHLDISRLRVRGGSFQNKSYGCYGGAVATALLAQIKSKFKIICSAISASGSFVAYSDHKKVKMIELKKSVEGKAGLKKKEANLLQAIPYAHTMIFTSDSSQLMVAGQDRRIYVVNAKSSDLVHTFTPRRVEQTESLPPSEPPITKLFASSDGQWLAAINCVGDIYIFNLETQRQHWFIARLDGASVTAGGFSPQNSNVLVLTTSSNQVYAFDVEAKQLGKWSMQHTFVLPKKFRDFPGEVIGLSFSPKSSSSSVIVYSARTTCSIDFEMPVDQADCARAGNGLDSASKSCIKLPIKGLQKRKLKDFVLPNEEGKNNPEMPGDLDYLPFTDNGRYSASKWLLQPPTAGKVPHKRTHTLENKACNLQTEDGNTYGMSVHQDDRPSMANGYLENGKQDGKSKDCDLRTDGGSKNFDFTYFREPILFLAHLSTDHVLVIDKPWMEVVKSFDTQPVHRHIYGT